MRIRRSGRLSTARAIPTFCRSANDSRDPPDANVVIEPDIDDGLPQRQRVDDFGEHRRDADRRISLAIGDLAEQDVVLYRSRRVVALGVEEFDLRPRLGRQIIPEYPAGFEQALLHRLVDDIEPVARRDQPEGQGEELCADPPVKARRRLALPKRPRIATNSGRSLALMKLNCSKNS